MGIYLDSVVCDQFALRQKVSHVIAAYRQPALVEPFIEGREVSVGMIGNGNSLTLFDPLEFLFPDASTPLAAFRSYEYKWGGKKEVMTKASLSDSMKKQLIDAARVAFVATECVDYARMDFRVTDRTCYLLEVNYNPGIGPNTHGLNNTLTMMASFHGISFEELIVSIVRIAAARNGL